MMQATTAQTEKETQAEKGQAQKTQDERSQTKRTGSPSSDSTHVLYTQIFVCIFLAAILFFAWKEGGPLWYDLSGRIRGFLENGVSFSGQQELTRFTDEVRDFWGNIVEAFLQGTPV